MSYQLNPNPNNNLKSKKHLLFIIGGFILIIISTVIALLIHCPSAVQYFIIYCLIAIGLGAFLPESVKKNSATFKIGQIKYKICGSGVLLVLLLQLNPIAKYLNADTCTIHFTNISVSVHGCRGHDDITLKGKGSVVVDIVGKEKKKGLINENGQAFISNLLIGDSVKLSIDFSEPYTAMYPDSIYIIKPNENIDLAIKLKGIEKIAGKTLFNGRVLDSVAVEVDSENGELDTITDKLGNFNIHIPDSIQSQRYQVIFKKKGFRTDTTVSYPQTGTTLKWVMTKK